MSESPHLLLADLERFGEAVLRNEDIGEKRFSFFLTLVTAVAAGLVALTTADPRVDPGLFRQISIGAVGFLLLVGLLTYLRLVQRNRVTDQYHRTLTLIRYTYAREIPELRYYRVPAKASREAPRGLQRSQQRLQNVLPAGGYVQTVAMINGLLLAVLLFLSFQLDIWLIAGAAIVFAAGQLFPAAWRDKEFEPPSQTFRAGVGAVIVNHTGHVLALERSDIRGAWQFPQGGLEPNEEPEHAVFREVAEETGISSDHLTLIDTFPTPLAYELPPDGRSVKTGRGQVQYWFLLRYENRDPRLAIPNAEFRDAQWRQFDEVLDSTVTFRKSVYEQLKSRFAAYLTGGRM